MITVSELRDALRNLRGDMPVKILTQAGEYDLEITGKWADLVVGMGMIDGIESLCFDDHEASRPDRIFTPLGELTE